MKAIAIATLALLVVSPALAQGGRDDRDRRSERWEQDDSSGQQGWHRESGRRSRGASFMVRRGDATIAVRCDPADSMRACVDATMMLLDRFRTPGTQGGGSSSGGSGTSP